MRLSGAFDDATGARGLSGRQCGIMALAYAVSLSPTSGSLRAAVRNALIYGLCGGLLFAVLRLTEYRFLVLEHSVELYGGLIAALFSAVGIWLGITLTRKKPEVIVKEVPVPVRVAGP